MQRPAIVSCGRDHDIFLTTFIFSRVSDTINNLSNVPFVVYTHWQIRYPVKRQTQHICPWPCHKVMLETKRYQTPTSTCYKKRFITHKK